MSEMLCERFEIAQGDFATAGEASGRIKRILKKLGVEEMEALGQPFDPQRHNAVMHIESEDLGENVVSQVFQAGFTLDGKVVRFAIVQVAN